MRKRYKITIQEEAEEMATSSGAWCIIDQVDGDSKWGNPPQIEIVEKVSRTVFVQDVDELDLVAVIKAVNGISN